MPVLIGNVCPRYLADGGFTLPVGHEPLLSANGDPVRIYVAGCSGVPVGKEGDDEIKLRICRRCSCLYLEW